MEDCTLGSGPGLGWSGSVLDEGALRGGCVMAERASPRRGLSLLF